MFNGAPPILLIVALLQTAVPKPRPARRVAVTIDDGPVVAEQTDLVTQPRYVRWSWWIVVVEHGDRDREGTDSDEAFSN